MMPMCGHHTFQQTSLPRCLLLASLDRMAYMCGCSEQIEKHIAHQVGHAPLNGDADQTSTLMIALKCPRAQLACEFCDAKMPVTKVVCQSKAQQSLAVCIRQTSFICHATDVSRLGIPARSRHRPQGPEDKQHTHIRRRGQQGHAQNQCANCTQAPNDSLEFSTVCCAMTSDI